MKTDFVLFGPLHLAIIASIPIAIVLLSRFVRRSQRAAIRSRMALGSLLALNELIWYSFLIHHNDVGFPDRLPLNLCDVTLWLTVLACFTLAGWATEVAYFAGAGGALMAVLTPDLWAAALSYPTAQFFVAHNGIVIAVGTLVFGGMVKLNNRSMWRALGVVNIYGMCVGAFNAAFGSNYMYLCRKPESASPLDYLGPWPVYILAGEAAALIIFALLALPFRRVTAPAS
jgi:hypothetical integral membrane protein (TIGR02206 family)